MGDGLLQMELHDLQVGGIALLMLLGLFGFHHLIFQRLRPGHDRLRLIQERFSYPSFIFVFLLPFYWSATKIPDLSILLDELYLSVIFLGLLLGLEMLYSLVMLTADGKPRLAANFHLGLVALMYGGMGAIYLALIFEFPITDPKVIYALITIFLVYVSLHLVYTIVFKWLPYRHPLAVALRQRLRFWAYCLVLSAVAYFAVTRYTFIPVTGTVVENLGLGLWVLVVFLVSESVLAGVFDFYFPVAKRSEIPTFFRDLTRALVYIGLFAFFVGFVLKKDLNSLLVGSAVITVSIGFALQETLGNFFAGLALRLSPPYTLGDYVEVAQVTGRVEKIDWRQTAILTRSGDYLVLPNSFMAKEAISNHSTPTRLHSRFIDVGLHYRHPPNTVKGACLGAVASVSEVLDEPKPELHILGFDDSSIHYQLQYWLADFGDRFRVDTKVRAALWYRFKREGLEIPFPIRTLIQEPPESQEVLEKEVLGFLETVDFLRALEPEDLKTLAGRARFQLYAGGEPVCVQGEAGDSFYVIKGGKVQVTASDDSGEIFLCAEMGAGNYFGEMALLTGEPRSATVSALVDSELLTITKDDLRSIITGNQEVEKIISSVLAQRQLRTAKAREEADQERAARKSEVRGGPKLEQLSEQLLKKIQEFFSY